MTQPAIDPDRDMTKIKNTTTGKAEADYRHPTSDLALRPKLATQARFRHKKSAKMYRYDPSAHPAFEQDGPE